MSDPVTNVEIEDVLSSIRRLVSDGDKASTRNPAPNPTPVAEDPAPVEAAQNEPHEESFENEVPSKPEKFVLTPAFMVVDDAASPAPDAHAAEAEADEDWFREEGDPSDTGNADDATSDEHQADEDQAEAAADDEHAGEPVEADHEADQSDEGHADDDTAEGDEIEDHASVEEAVSSTDDADDDAPLPLTQMVWDTADEDSAASRDDATPTIETPDRSELVATIAELEAAVSKDHGDYEPDGSEEMGQTIAWPGAIARRFDDVEDAEPATETDKAAPAEADAPDTAADPEPTAAADPEADVYQDDDLDGLLEAGGVTLDEEALRALVSEVVREELTGPLGERITRNVRKLVRREIYRILSSQDFD